MNQTGDTSDLVTRVRALEEEVTLHGQRLSRLETRLAARPSTPPPTTASEASPPTRSALPPSFVQELADKLAAHVENESDAVVGLCAVLTRREGRVTGAGTWLTRFDPVKEDVAGPEVAAFAAPFASPQRVAVMNVLARRGQLGSRELSEAAGLMGGQFYHHLRELIRAGLVVSDVRSHHRLTERGSAALYAMAVLSRE